MATAAANPQVCEIFFLWRRSGSPVSKYVSINTQTLSNSSLPTFLPIFIPFLDIYEPFSMTVRLAAQMAAIKHEQTTHLTAGRCKTRYKETWHMEPKMLYL